MNTEEIRNDEAFMRACKVNNLNPDRIGIAKNVILVPTNKRGLVAYMTNNYQIKDVDVDIAKDSAFIEKMHAFGLNPTDFYLFENVIAVATPKKGYYCLMDRNFNIFWISKYREDRLEEISEFLYKAYTSSVAFEEDSWTFPKPFSKLSLSELMTLASRIDGINSKSFHLHDKRKMFISINKELYMVPKKDIYGSLLCFIKYLSISSEFYFEKLFPLMLGEVVKESDIASPGAYLISIINNLFAKTKEIIDNHGELDYKEIISSFGQRELIDKVETFMPAVIDLLKRYYEGEVTLDTLEGMVDSMATMLELDDKTWRQKDGIIHLSQKSLENLFDKPQEDKKMDLLPRDKE